MNEKKIRFLLDMDGVLTDLLTPCIELFNEKLGLNFTVEEYVLGYGKYDIPSFFGVDVATFWNIIELEREFWMKLKPLPWFKELYDYLKSKGDITIVTAPVWDYNCPGQKLWWLDKYLGIKAPDVFIGSKKYLLAGNGILIDDSPKNIEAFKNNGGRGILIPSNWNTVDLTFKQVKEVIDQNL